MPQLHFVIPGDPETLTGGAIYDKRIVGGLRDLGWRVFVHAIAGSFPGIGERAALRAGESFSRLPDGAAVVIDGLALGDLVPVLRAHASRLRLIALIHYAVACQHGLAAARRRDLMEREQAGLACVARTIVTSPHLARGLARRGLPSGAVGIAEPGTDPAPLSVGTSGDAVSLLCVAAVAAHKGHDVLVEALRRLGHLPWSLVCAGDLTREPATAAAVRDAVAARGLGARIRFTGEVAPVALATLYDRADVFVLASYHEGYGMALSEALARGLPIVSTTGGAIPETVPAAAGVFVPPGDSHALAEALAAVIADGRLRARLAGGARRARHGLADWGTAARRFAAEIERALDE